MEAFLAGQQEHVLLLRLHLTTTAVPPQIHTQAEIGIFADVSIMRLVWGGSDWLFFAN